MKHWLLHPDTPFAAAVVVLAVFEVAAVCGWRHL
jgi:hypothetical protein